MRIKNRLLLSALLLFAIALTACGTSANAASEVAPATTASPLSPMDTAVVGPTDTSAPAPTRPAEALPTTNTASTDTSVSFTNDVLPIFESRCVKCHGGESTKEGLDLNTHASLMAGSQNGSVLTPGSADDSFLVEQIIEGEMPKRGPRLTPNEIQIIIDWVNAGAPNN